MSASKKDRDYLEALTKQTVDLMKGGVADPSCEDIADAYFEGLSVGGEFPESVRKKAPKILTQIETDYPDWSLCQVNETYYRRFRHGMDDPENEAKLCLPHNGTGNGVFGIRRCTTDDPIFRAEVERNMKAGAGKTARNVSRVVTAHDQHEISEENVLEIFEKARAMSLPPAAIALLEQARTLALEAGNGDGDGEIAADEDATTDEEGIVSREQDEARILTLVQKAVARIEKTPANRESYVEIAVVNDMIGRGTEKYGPGFRVQMTRAITGLGEITAMLYASTLSQLLWQAEREKEEIADGIPFEWDGSTYQAVDIDVLSEWRSQVASS